MNNKNHKNNICNKVLLFIIKDIIYYNIFNIKKYIFNYF